MSCHLICISRIRLFSSFYIHFHWRQLMHYLPCIKAFLVLSQNLRPVAGCELKEDKWHAIHISSLDSSDWFNKFSVFQKYLKKYIIFLYTLQEQKYLVNSEKVILVLQILKTIIFSSCNIRMLNHNFYIMLVFKYFQLKKIPHTGDKESLDQCG